MTDIREGSSATRSPVGTVRLEREPLVAFLAEVFPQVSPDMAIETVGPMHLVVGMDITEAHLRPGGTVSGPTMFTLADFAYYAVTLAMIGREALTVTTSLTINFLRKPAPTRLLAEARILKLGRTQSVGDVTIWNAGDDRPVAHCAVTYAIPPRDVPSGGNAS